MSAASDELPSMMRPSCAQRIAELQFAAHGAPLWGDAKYGGGGEGDIALFSCVLAFPHPLTGDAMTFEKKPPAAYPWTEFSGEE